MKKTGIILLMACLVLGNLGFADDGGSSDQEVSLSDNQSMMFNVPIDVTCFGDIFDFDYNMDEKLLYIITSDEDDLEGDISYSGYQFTFELDGDFEENPLYPELDISDRKGIEFGRDGVYSLECGDYSSLVDDSGSDTTFIYDAKNEAFLAEHDVKAKYGFAATNPYIAFLYNRRSSTSEDDPNFLIDEIELLGTTEGEHTVLSPDAGRIYAYDFTPSGSEFIFGAFTCSDDGIGAGLRVVSVDSSTGKNTGNDFLVTLPEGVDASDFGSDWREYGFRGISATNDYIVVLYRLSNEDCGYIQRYSYSGELLESYKTEYCVSEITEGPNDSTLYLRKSHENSNFDVMKVSWDIEEPSIGRPKSVIAERSFGGKTLAEFKDAGFGLLKVVDPETGAIDYKAPLKSDKKDVRLRIPFADMQAKLAAGANHLLINYMGQEIAIPMSAFDCTDLLAGMPCQDDATIEIHLIADEAGNVTVTVQLFVVEQVNSMTKVVHRKTIQY
jgi:hypothetical protein